MCSGQLSLLTSAGWEMGSSLRAMGWRPSVANWGGGMSASSKPWVQLFADADNGWLHALQYHQLIPISCHFWDCIALLVASLTYLRGAIASAVLNFTFTFTCLLTWALDWMTVRCRRLCTVALTNALHRTNDQQHWSWWWWWWWWWCTLLPWYVIPVTTNNTDC